MGPTDHETIERMITLWDQILSSCHELFELYQQEYFDPYFVNPQRDRKKENYSEEDIPF